MHASQGIALKNDGLWPFECPHCGHRSLIYGRFHWICEHGVSSGAMWVCQACRYSASDNSPEYEQHLDSHYTGA